ncbi:hypothetical protein DX908_02665 [Parvularcula marina]|uniref:Uncharacterized protein n=1 Tax=Parvularcula marina TaxID=2292771 RepID=A0A371RFQ5_9PROT|nr:hypothetical protein DX908_02665 [Parvularcula marina]
MDCYIALMPQPGLNGIERHAFRSFKVGISMGKLIERMPRSTSGGFMSWNMRCGAATENAIEKMVLRSSKGTERQGLLKIKNGISKISKLYQLILSLLTVTQLPRNLA